MGEALSACSPIISGKSRDPESSKRSIAISVDRRPRYRQRDRHSICVTVAVAIWNVVRDELPNVARHRSHPPRPRRGAAISATPRPPGASTGGFAVGAVQAPPCAMSGPPPQPPGAAEPRRTRSTALNGSRSGVTATTMLALPLRSPPQLPHPRPTLCLACRRTTSNPSYRRSPRGRKTTPETSRAAVEPWRLAHASLRLRGVGELALGPSIFDQRLQPFGRLAAALQQPRRDRRKRGWSASSRLRASSRSWLRCADPGRDRAFASDGDERSPVRWFGCRRKLNE
jgi:hypothetical protein